MKWPAILLLVGAALIAAPASAQLHETPIPGAPGWSMVDRAPPVEGPPCFARTNGPELNTQVVINLIGRPVLTLGRGNTWSDLKGEILGTASMDGGPPVSFQGSGALNLILIEPGDAWLAQLRTARMIDWTLPTGHFRGRIEGFDAALAAVKACMIARDGALPKPPGAPS